MFKINQPHGQENDMRSYKKLTLKESFAVAEYIRINQGKFDGKTQELLAAECAAALGFDVPAYSFVRVAKTIGLPIKRKKKEKTAPKKAVAVDQNENKVIHRRMRTLARIQRKIVDELGIKLKPIQDQILTQLCQYDVTGQDDEQ